MPVEACINIVYVSDIFLIFHLYIAYFFTIFNNLFVDLQLSFQMWTNQMQDTLNSKKKGDSAFRHKDFRAAIDCYSQVKFYRCGAAFACSID